MADCHSSRGLNVTQSESYQYFSEIEEYTDRYPRYYQTIDVIERTNDGLTASIFLNVNLSITQDHVRLKVKYSFIPEKEIRYEVISGPGQGIIKNSLVIRGQDIVVRDHYRSAVEVNHVPFDLLCYPPPYYYDPNGENYKHYIFYPGSARLGEYERMVTYFTEQDLIPLEKKFHWGGFKIGELCNRCRKGQLQMTGKKEDTGTYRAEFLRCDYCGSEFKNQRIGF